MRNAPQFSSPSRSLPRVWLSTGSPWKVSRRGLDGPGSRLRAHTAERGDRAAEGGPAVPSARRQDPGPSVTGRSLFTCRKKKMPVQRVLLIQTSIPRRSLKLPFVICAVQMPFLSGPDGGRIRPSLVHSRHSRWSCSRRSLAALNEPILSRTEGAETQGRPRVSFLQASGHVLPCFKGIFWFRDSVFNICC